MSSTRPPTAKRALVLGGGFAGVQAAIALSRSGRFAVTLVSDRDYLHLFPISIWIPTRTVRTERTRVPLSAVGRAHGFEVVVSSVRSIDQAAGAVRVGDATLGYDYLVIALGSGKTARPGSEHTASLCAGPDAAYQIRTGLDELLARGHGRIAVGFGGNPKDGSAVRGGPAFEFLFNLDHLLRRRGVREAFQLTFFAPMPNPGARMGAKAVALLPPQIEARGVELRTGTPIDGFDEGGVRLADGSRIDADLVMFIPGATGHPVAVASGLPVNEAGFLRIDDHGLVEGTSNVYAVGDVAALDGPPWRAKQGHVAEVMARAAAYNITQSEAGRPQRRGYREHVSIVCLMDTGNGAILVYRSTRRELVVPLPVVGHWLKRGWGLYARGTVTGRLPRLPGL
jgi:sulfide:quinone oxidoreductase